MAVCFESGKGGAQKRGKNSAKKIRRFWALANKQKRKNKIVVFLFAEHCKVANNISTVNRFRFINHFLVLLFVSTRRLCFNM